MRIAAILTATVLAVAAARAERDYLNPSAEEYSAWEAANSREAPRKPAVRAVSGDGTTVSYKAFDDTVYTGMSEYRGKFVRVIFNPLWMTSVTEAQRIQFLDYADRVYSDYRQFVGREPTGTGLLSIAMVTTCGYGCGYIGRKGIELDPTASFRDDMLAVLAENGSNSTVTHEFAHNFDVFHDHLEYWSDWGHAWTWINSFLHHYSREGFDKVPATQRFRMDRHTTYDPYISDPALNWTNCVAGAGCTSDRKNRIWAGLLFRFAELHGPAAAVRFMEFLRNYTAANAIPASNSLKADLHIEALAYGAQRNLGCYVDRWRWTASPALRTRMTTQYGAVNSNCQDQDGDGFSILDGDPDDANPGAKPGASEIAANGRDDNANGLVDETAYDEPASGDFASDLPISLPAAISGQLTASDGDKFRMTLTQRTAVLLTLQSLGAMRGWVFVYKQDNTWLDYRYASTGEAEGLLVDLGAGTWTFEVALNSASTPGAYRLHVEAVPLPGSWAAASATGNRLRLTSPNTTRYSQAPDGLEVWLGRYGVIRRLNWNGSSNVDIDVTNADAPGAESGAAYPYAFRATRLGVPVTDWTDYPAATQMIYTPPPLSIITPATGSTLATTIVSFQWTPVTGATGYDLRLIEANTPQQFRVTLLAGSTSAVYTVKSGSYRMELQACTASGCGSPAISNFVVAAGAIPPVAPAGVSCQAVNDAGQNRINCNWNAVAGTHFYFVNIVQPGAGPGGGALTVAGGQAGTNSASFLVPNGSASVIVRACTGDGCGPFSAAVPVNATVGNPNVPVLGEPFAGSSFDSGSSAPAVTFSWSRVAGDNGSNYTYRLYVQDFSRNRPALDVYTTNNFHAAYFNPGTRYDALVIAIPNGGGQQRQGPPSAFVVRGNVPKSPVAVEPGYRATIDRNSQGKVRVAWTPIVNLDGTVSTRLYQYFLSGPTQISGVTTDTFADLTLASGSWQGIMRACNTGTACTASSPAGWGPWNNAVGSEGGPAAFTVR